jgi:hypothetical protein
MAEGLYRTGAQAETLAGKPRLAVFVINLNVTVHIPQQIR